MKDPNKQPPVKRITTARMMQEAAGVGPEIWDDPGMGDIPGGAYGDGQMRGSMPNGHQEINASVFHDSAQAPPEGPPPPPYPPNLGQPPVGQNPPAAVPTGPVSWWRPEWTPVAVVGGIFLFWWWYNKNAGGSSRS